jgi:hypothetical protein
MSGFEDGRIRKRVRRNSLNPRYRSEYDAWHAMKQRCFNPRHKQYDHYGGRGITVCEEWWDFEAFFRAMGPKPSPSHSIDRINNNDGYRPGNCRWATQHEQNLNTRQNRYLTYNGKTQTLDAWCTELGIKRGTIDSRLCMGYPIERVLSPANHRKKITIEEIRRLRERGLSGRQIAKRYGMSSSSIYERLRKAEVTHV